MSKFNKLKVHQGVRSTIKTPLSKTRGCAIISKKLFAQESGKFWMIIFASFFGLSPKKCLFVLFLEWERQVSSMRFSNKESPTKD